MGITPHQIAPGAPGGSSRWTHSTKKGLDTAYHTGCHLWFTLSHGVVDEIYYPTIDQPSTRDFQLLITDGANFCHEEKRHLIHRIEYPEKDSLFYRITNSDPDGRYRIIKHVLTDPHRSVLLMQVRLEVIDETLRGKLRVYALLAPHLARRGADNLAWVCEFAGRQMFHAAREDVHLSPRLRARLYEALCRLRRRERWLAGLDGELPHGLGVPRCRGRQSRADGGAGSIGG